ncbi:MAG: cell division protein FtsQ/DivIB [Thermodesulfobacteriota bacterium]
MNKPGTKPRRKNRYKKEARPPTGIRFPRLAWQWLKAACGFSGFCLMGVFFIFSYDAMTQCDYFRAADIPVHGEERLSEGTVLEMAELEEGVNILSVNLSMIRKRLVAAPWIQSAAVRRELPSRLSVSVREHEPLAVLDVGRLFLINTAGRIFKEAEPMEMTGLPVISGMDYVDWKRSDGPETKVFKAVMTFLDLLEKKPSLFSDRAVREIRVDPEMGLSVRMSEPMVRVELGFDAYEQKLQRVRRILAHVAANDRLPAVEVLDAHNPKRIIATPADRKRGEANKEV